MHLLQVIFASSYMRMRWVTFIVEVHQCTAWKVPQNVSISVYCSAVALHYITGVFIFIADH